MTTKRMKKGALAEEGEIHYLFIFIFAKKKPMGKKPMENFSWKTLPRAHTSPLYWTNGLTNFKNFFTVLCSHTFLIVWEYSCLSLCAQFLVFLVYRSTDGQLIAAGLPNLQLVEDNWAFAKHKLKIRKISYSSIFHGSSVFSAKQYKDYEWSVFSWRKM